jgi:PAS domain S-box-containing protein
MSGFANSASVEQRFALAMEAAQLGSWMWDMASGETTWDVRLEELHGLRPGEFGGTYEDWVEALHPDDRAACIARVERALAHPGPYELLHRTTWPDGSVHVIECRGTVLVDDEGNPTGTTGVAVDVTDRERRESAVHDALAHERHVVRTFQQALLPRRLPQVPGVRVAARYRAAEVVVGVGGDWYVVVALDDGRLALAVGDVTGHGIEAVAEMAVARFSLRALALTEPRPDVVLDRLNKTVKTFEGDTMITALYGVLDPHEHTWTYASAGHMPSVLRQGSGSACFLDDQPDPPLGFAESFRSRSVKLSDDASLLLYTDGLVERRGEPITAGLSRLQEACSNAPRDADAFGAHVLTKMLGESRSDDDVALLAVSLT